MVRRFTVSASSKDRMRISLEGLIVTERGALTRDELVYLKETLASKLMVALTEVRFLNVNLSEVKVTR